MRRGRSIDRAEDGHSRKLGEDRPRHFSGPKARREDGDRLSAHHDNQTRFRAHQNVRWKYVPDLVIWIQVRPKALANIRRNRHGRKVSSTSTRACKVRGVDRPINRVFLRRLSTGRRFCSYFPSMERALVLTSVKATLILLSGHQTLAIRRWSSRWSAPVRCSERKSSLSLVVISLRSEPRSVVAHRGSGPQRHRDCPEWRVLSHLLRADPRRWPDVQQSHRLVACTAGLSGQLNRGDAPALTREDARGRWSARNISA